MLDNIIKHSSRSFVPSVIRLLNANRSLLESENEARSIYLVFSPVVGGSGSMLLIFSIYHLLVLYGLQSALRWTDDLSRIKRQLTEDGWMMDGWIELTRLLPSLFTVCKPKHRKNITSKFKNVMNSDPKVEWDRSGIKSNL